MVDGLDGGTSQRLTPDSAAKVFEGLLSADPEYSETREETQPEEEQPEVVEGEPEPELEEPTDDQPATDEEVDEPQEELDEEPAQPRTFKVKVDGQEVEVPEDELLKGYSRTADYTRKTQELAAQRKAQENEFEAVKQERQRYATDLQRLEAMLDSQVQEPDWDKLRKENPEAFADTWADWDRFQKQRSAIKAEREEATRKVAADQAESFTRTIEGEKSKLLEALPAWNDADVAKKERAELVDYAKSVGYSDDDISRVYDHRLILLLRDAAAHRRAEKAKPEVKKKIEQVRVAAPGPKSSRKPVTEVTKAKQRLAKTGRVEDAAKAFEQML